MITLILISLTIGAGAGLTTYGIIEILEKGKRKYKAKDFNYEGEELVYKKIKAEFDKSYHLINNVTLPKGDNGSVQIDHILISEFGIFVIETKHYSGWIFGKEEDYQWTQTFKTQEKYKFLNPIKQNEGHIKQLSQLIYDTPINSFISIVVFTGEGEIKTNVGEKVVYLKDLTNLIKKYKEKIVSLDKIHNSIGKIEYHRKEESEKTDKEHIEYVKGKIKKRFPQSFHFNQE